MEEMHFAKFILVGPGFSHLIHNEMRIRQSPQNCCSKICKPIGNYYVQIQLGKSSVKEFSITHGQHKNGISMLYLMGGSNDL